MLSTIDRDTRLCMSLSGRPGNTGTRFHNFLYRELGLNYVYKAFSTDDIAGAITGVRALGVRGCAISMPFKEAVIPLVDRLMPSAQAIQSVNTIVNDEGQLSAFNTDYAAVRSLLDRHAVDRAGDFVVQGSGGMAKAVAIALRDAGFCNGLILSRNPVTGQALAAATGLHWLQSLGELRPSLLVNATPVGMAGGAEAESLAFAPEAIEKADAIIDVVAMPIDTPLLRMAHKLGKQIIHGGEIMTLQAVEQFVLYTGIRPDDALIQQAQDFARAV